jgi:superfamily II DNA or RNA helicase
MGKPTIHVKQKAYVPIDYVNMDDVRDNYVVKMYDESKCSRCEYLKERHSYACDACPAEGYKGTVTLYSTMTNKGTKYIGLPVGDRLSYFDKLGIRVKHFNVIDHRNAPRFRYKIKFTADLRDYQEPLYDDFLNAGFGIIEAPPRTGKTVVALSILIALGYRCLIIAKQKEFLDHFLEHIETMTNLPKIQKRVGKRLYGYAKNPEDFDDMEICLSTYQRFISEGGRKLLRKVKKNWGAVAIDEVHGVAAMCFSEVVGSIPARHVFGVTGTPDRKDGMHFITYSLVGPVVARTKIESMNPTVFVHDTNIKCPHQHKIWQYAMRYLATHDARNKMIVDYVEQDLKKGHCIVIPVTFKYHVDNLVQMINARMGKNVAEPFTGGAGEKGKQKRADTLEKAKTRKILVVVGIRQLIQLGLNVPPWSAIYEVIPISNEPNLKQETSRVRTPDPSGKKPNPIVRYFVDPAMGASLGCFRNSFRHMIGFGYDIDHDSKTLAYKIMGGKGRDLEHDEYKTWSPDDGDKPKKAKRMLRKTM